MLATQAISRGAPVNGPRPIDLRKDKGQIIHLLNLTFGRRNRRFYTSQINFNLPTPISLSRRITQGGIIPGFVWEQSGEILGNVSLVETKIKNRFIIANVAVHPKHQRRGIARILMVKAIDYINQNHGKKILLQVERDNTAAIQLYLSLGFSEVGTVNHWSTNISSVNLPDYDYQQIRSLNRHDWLHAYLLDRQVMQPDLNWPIPLSRDFFKLNLLRRLIDLLNGQKLEGWVIENPTASGKSSKLAGLVTLFSDWGRPSSVRLRVHQSWQGRFENMLLFVALGKLKDKRVGSAVMLHPADDKYVNGLLFKANFQIKRELTTMRLYLKDTDGDA